jgi:selenocysteine lyase/cysteine desulfurase
VAVLPAADVGFGCWSRMDACKDGDGQECYTADGKMFGAALRDRFLLAEGFTNFNHGSFGSVPKDVSEAQRRYSLQCEARPDRWFRQDYFVCVDAARSMLAKYINAPSADDVVMVENASGAGIYRPAPAISARFPR